MRRLLRVLQLLALLARANAQCNVGFTGPDESGPCTACVAGTYKTDTGSATCTDCGAGTYSAATGATAAATCVTCPTSSSSPIASSTLTACTCNVGFTGPSGGTCLPCAAGTFKSSTGNVSCTACVYGSNSTSGQSACFCLAGFFANGSVCIPFDAKIVTVNNPLVNLLRSCGTSQNQQCSTMRALKSDGGIALPSASTGINDGTVNSESHFGYTDCKDQSTGEFCITFDLEQERTVVLAYAWWRWDYYFDTYYKFYTYSVRVGNTDIAYVNGQTFIPGSWNTRLCTPTTAQVNSVLISVTGATYANHQKFTIGCSNNVKGRYFSLNNGGSYSSQYREVEAIGYLTGDGAQSTYYACNAGYTGPRGGPCAACAVGTYKDTASIAACTLCPANSNSSANSNMLSNCSCNPGYTGSNGGPCVACQAGKFKDVSGTAACMNCTANSGASCSGCTALASCTCNAGFYGPNGGTCTTCPANSGASCSGCTTLANCTCNVGYTGPNGSPCPACVAGSYKTSTGSAACTNCSTGTYSATTGATVATVCLACALNRISSAGVGNINQCVCNAGYTHHGMVDLLKMCGSTFPARCTPVKEVNKDGTISTPGVLNACNDGNYNTAGGTMGQDKATSEYVIDFDLGVERRVDTVVAFFEESVYQAYFKDLYYSVRVGNTSNAYVSGSIGTFYPANINTKMCPDQRLMDNNQYMQVSGAGATFFRRVTFACSNPIFGRYFTFVKKLGDATFINMQELQVLGYLSTSTSVSDDLAYAQECSVCAAGKYKGSVGTLACTDCPSNSGGSCAGCIAETGCTCNAGFYGPNGKPPCTACATNSNSPISSTVVTSCICNVGYTGPNGGPCSVCVTGTFKGVTGTAACTNCSAGTYSTTTGATACLACPANSGALCNGCTAVCQCTCNNIQFAQSYYGPNGGTCTGSPANSGTSCYGTACTSYGAAYGATWSNLPCVACTDISKVECNVGTTGPNGGPCTVCPAGFYKRITGSSSCWKCPQNTTHSTAFPTNGICVCPDGNWRSDGTNACSGCPLGYYTSANVCTKCAVGTYGTLIYANDGEAGVCTWCPQGKYTAVTGSTTCTNCSTANSGSACGSGSYCTLSTHCTCNSGYTGPNGGNCTLCAAGKFKVATTWTNGASGGACTDCATGSYSDTAGASACTLCPAGKYSAVTATNSSGACLSCPANSGSTCSTTACTASTTCPCNAGYTGANGGPCTGCVAGTYKAGTGSVACVNCLAGSYSSILGASVCTNCPQATYSAVVASTTITNCLACNANTGSTCGVTQLCSVGVSTGTPPVYNPTLGCKCDPGYNYDLCTAVPAGTYKPGIGYTGFLFCPSNSISPIASSSITNCTCNIGYTGPNGGSCVTCAAGTYKNYIGSICSACPLNSGASCVGCTSIAACTCNLGYYGPGGGPCTACPANSGQDGTRTALSTCACNVGYTGPSGGNCTACVTGTFKSVTGAAVCTSCAAGSHTASMSGATTCTTCGLGYYSSVGGSNSSICVACPVNSGSICTQGSNINVGCCTCNIGYTGPTGNCTACAPGKYKTATGTVSCTDCAIGMYSSITAATTATTCVACPIGTYNPSTGVTQCLSCPSGSGATCSACNTISACVCNTGYTGPNGNCTSCVAGTYKIITGTATCISCPANSGSTEINSSVASTCKCNSGYYGPNGGVCTSCPQNSGASCYGCTSICDCACNSAYSGPNSGLCVAMMTCNAGYAGTTNCTACGAGTYKGSIGNVSCTSCPLDTYSDTGSLACVSCPNQSTSPILSSALVACICNAGYQGPSGGPCTACVAGQYKTATGSASCTNCQAGAYSTVTGATSSTVCTLCPNSTFSAVIGSPNASFCQSCQANAISAAGSVGQEYCYCKAGYAHAEGEFKCNACTPGTYNSQLARKACSNCTIGMYSVNYSATGPETCQACPAGQWSPEGSANCNLCPSYSHTLGTSGSIFDCVCDAGYTGPAGLTCTPCVAGTYKITTGSGQCTSCPAGMISPIGSTSSADCVSAGCNAGYTGPSDGTCTACVAGKYKNATGFALCADCSAGTYLTTTGATDAAACVACPANSNSPQGSTACACNAGFAVSDNVCVCDLGYEPGV